MKGHLKVGKGNGDLPSIPGVTENLIADDYSDVDSEIPDPVTKTAPVEGGVDAATTIQSAAAGQTSNTSSVASADLTATQDDSIISGVLVVGLAIGFFLAPWLGRKLKGKSFAESVSYLFELVGDAIALVIKPIKALINLVFSKTKSLPPQQ
jgi:hypothetical protein